MHTQPRLPFVFKRITSYSTYLEVENIRWYYKVLVVVFARYGVPDTLVTDNGPQFSVLRNLLTTRKYILDYICNRIL